MPPVRSSILPAVLVVAVAAAGCTPAKRTVRTTGSTSTATSTRTITLPPRTVPATRTAAATGPLPQPHRVDERAGDCPYLGIRSAELINGSLIKRHTVVTTTPVGCRFYARNAAGYGQKGPAGRPVVAISTARYRTAADAEQGMIRAALRGTDEAAIAVDGHSGATFRVKFSPTDSDQDWACTFVTGAVVVTVNTDQTDFSTNAVNLATAISPKFGVPK